MASSLGMPPPRLAVFGAGLIGQRHMAQARAHANLVAVVDPVQQTETDDTAWFADPAECLAVMDLDGVIIATPNHLHAAHALLCIDAGLPVLIEKPIADTHENAARIVEAAARADVPVLVGHHRRHNPIIARAKEIISAGTLGEIVAVQGTFWLYKPEDYFEAAWRSGPGAGPTLINFIHDIDLLRHLCGDLTQVSAMRSNRQRGHGVEDTAVMMMRFENGALGTFSVSDTVVAPWSWEMTSGENPIYPNRPGAAYHIGGTQASLSVPDLQLWTHEGPRSWWNPIHSASLDVANEDAFARQFSHFLDVIAGAPPLVSAEEGKRSLEAVLQVLEAPLDGTELGAAT